MAGGIGAHAPRVRPGFPLAARTLWAQADRPLVVRSSMWNIGEPERVSAGRNWSCATTTMERKMADDKAKQRPQDSSRVSLKEDYEREYWTKKFGVSAQELGEAVRAVGPSAQKVEEHLKGR
jgi:Protein of unknown function (DUF3606)